MKYYQIYSYVFWHCNFSISSIIFAYLKTFQIISYFVWLVLICLFQKKIIFYPICLLWFSNQMLYFSIFMIFDDFESTFNEMSSNILFCLWIRCKIGNCIFFHIYYLFIWYLQVPNLVISVFIWYEEFY